MTQPVYSEFSAGKVISKSFEILKQNILLFIIISLFSGAIIGFFGFTGLISFNNFSSTTPTYIFLIFLLILLMAIIYVFFSILIIEVSLQSLNGIKPNINRLFSSGLSCLFPVIGVYIVSGLAIAAGYMLLIIPGIMWTAKYYVAIPVKIAENRPVLECLTRSGKLTDGHRWSTFALYFIPYFLNTIISGIFESFSSTASAFFGLLLFILYLIITIIFTAVTYHELVSEKEGGRYDDISNVFS